jgi:CDP-4-dehydro-6-deoxyglucose reductase
MQTLTSIDRDSSLPEGSRTDARIDVASCDRIIRGTVVRVDRPTTNVTILTVRLPADANFSYVPGQYINVLGNDRRFRSYSLARAAAIDGCIDLHIGRVAGGLFSDISMRTIRVGDSLSWLGPFGDFHWHERAGKKAVFLCTGTGFAPVRALLEHILGADHNATAVLYWGGRKLSDLYARSLLKGWSRDYPNFRFVPVLSEGDYIEGSSIKRGYVQQVAMQDYESFEQLMVYACGSPRMVSTARQALIEERGLSEDAFFADPFGELAGVPNRDVVTDDGEIIRIKVGGVTHSVRSGTTLLRALQQTGVPIQSVCGGRRACGTCIVDIEPAWAGKIPVPTDDERDILSFTSGLKPTSRLACQIELEPDMDELALHVR